MSTQLTGRRPVMRPAERCSLAGLRGPSLLVDLIAPEARGCSQTRANQNSPPPIGLSGGPDSSTGSRRSPQPGWPTPGRDFHQDYSALKGARSVLGQPFSWLPFSSAGRQAPVGPECSLSAKVIRLGNTCTSAPLTICNLCRPEPRRIMSSNLCAN